MARRLVMGACGVVALAVLALIGVRNSAVSADDAAGKKAADVVSRLETRIATLERRIAVLEKQHARGETRLLAQPQHLDGNWCYTILIDGNNTAIQPEAAKVQR
jgi:hypothetical protein